ncbi:hypothetical protein WJX72_005462 [[Myrmecia] bisecta]|uniref:AMMECR1 domain-containing protein n=1 Tax=[Myrmecia] bisecta TaxID=41462 RepID=A0AAW1PD75_9CHLO
MQTVQENGSSTTASKEHVLYCFDILVGHYNGDDSPQPLFDDAFCPLFVTWNKASRQGDIRLRGCIGTLEPRQLHTALRDYALTSALRDRRFSPVTLKELASLHCTVSLLHNFTEAASWQDWQAGRHGLILDFNDPETGAHRSATFLPEVAKHEGWSQQQTIDALIRKAGFNGLVTRELREAVSLTRYESTAHSLTYAEYETHKASLSAAAAPLPVQGEGLVVVQA